MLRVLTLSTLFPDATRRNFGVFVERQTLGLAAHPRVELRVVAPLGLPPFPLALTGRHAALARLPLGEQWKGIDVYRPRFLNVPGTAGRFHVGALTRSLRPVLANIRRDFAFDVIDASFFFPDGPAAVAMGKAFGVPVSIKARGSDIHHWGMAAATGGQVRAAGRDADGVLAVSAAMKRDMVAIGMPADRIRVHRTGVDLGRFVPRDRHAAKAALKVAGALVVSNGALIDRKGHDIVIDAVAALPNATLLIAGEGPYRGALETKIAALGLEDRVRLLGAVPHGEMADLLGAADVMALASVNEGLANAWVEALACGTPIVVPDVGGAAEVVTERAYGRIVGRSAAGFASGIAAVIADRTPSAQVRAGAERFTWEANTAGLYEHLSGLVAQYRG
ncbi:glycosyltransferase [Sphingomonas sp.]|jgi:glycosyltransferase involved in cell wall biosynthesis|uniref:glycosyltransferase n=1 Tax=Sphingomonas sp. TaxID=28214 RepID=UPI002E335F57|nr:glycosyltransferase [Sphingomonas sp.]HEX4695465.1 glycosyltransferase [Sphingomonas sp.]